MTEFGNNNDKPILCWATVDGDLTSCWFCQQRLSARALFCHNCGCLQAPRNLDHFSRLGLPRRYDIDLAVLERQVAGFLKTLESSRFSRKGKTERAYVAQQQAAFQLARDTLYDPLARARYLLGLEKVSLGREGGRVDEIVALKEAFEKAEDVAVLDRLALQVVRALEKTMYSLAEAFRAGDLTLAAVLVTAIEGLEDLAGNIRKRRTFIAETQKQEK